MTTRVVNLNHEAYDVYVGRAGYGFDGYFGNPHRLHDFPSRRACIEAFKEYFLKRLSWDSAFKERVIALRGKRLGCHCKPKKCHGDVIAAWVDAQPESGE